MALPRLVMKLALIAMKNPKLAAAASTALLGAVAKLRGKTAARSGTKPAAKANKTKKK